MEEVHSPSESPSFHNYEQNPPQDIHRRSTGDGRPHSNFDFSFPPILSGQPLPDPQQHHHQHSHHYVNGQQGEPLPVIDLQKFHLEMGAIGEEQLLSLSSPEPDLEDLLFPNLGTPASTVNEVEELEVSLCHKPRGCRGIWQKVEPRSALRVTKGKGKWLKLEVKCQEELAASSVEVFLLDIRGNPPYELVHSQHEGIVIESVTSTRIGEAFGVDVEIKLDRTCKKLQFWVVANTQYKTLKGRSVEFAAHNNGKTNTSTKVLSDGSSPLTSEGSEEGKANELHGAILKVEASAPPERVPKKRRKREPSNEITEVEEVREEMSKHPEPITYIQGSLQVSQTVRAKAFVQFSDMRLKADIRELSDAVAVVTRLEGKSFVWKQDQEENGQGGKRVIGLIAQEVQKVVPEVVHEDKNGLLSVAYAELIPFVIQAFREHFQTFQIEKEETAEHIRELTERLIKLENEGSAGHELEVSEDSSIPSRRATAEHSKKEDGRIFGGHIGTAKRSVIRSAVLIGFLVGITAIIFGAILLGIVLAGPGQLMHTTVVEAIELKTMDADGVPDPFCKISAGPHAWETQVLWNTPDPVFKETFIGAFDESISELVFQMYDSNQFAFSERRIGYAIVEVPDMYHLALDGIWESWIELIPNSLNDTMPGRMRVQVKITPPRQVLHYELAIVAAGVVIAITSLFVGFYTWKSTQPSLKSAQQ